jgi:hypothetical protein
VNPDEQHARVRSVRVDFPPGGPGEVDVIPVMPVRRCGYSQCGTELVYDGKGRPPEYCPDRRWPSGKTCRQLAAAEREGLRAAGLDAPLAEYAASTDRFVAVAGPLAEYLTAVLDTVDEVRGSALTRVGEAERQKADALERATDAERAAQAARQAEASAVAASGIAHAEAREARARLVEARADAEARVAAATSRLAAVEREHGQAAAQQRAAELRAVKAIAEATLFRRRAEEAATEIGRLQQQVQNADTDRRMMTQRIKDQQQRIADLTDQRRVADEREKDQTAVVAALRTENTALNSRLNDARVAAAAADARAAAAEARYTELLAVLSDPARRGAAPKGPTL